MIEAAFAFLLLVLLAVPVPAWGLGRSGRATSPAAAVLLLLGLVAGIVAAVHGLGSGTRLTLDLSFLTPFPFAMAVDRLSAFFLLLICCVACPVTLYAGSYLPRHYSKEAAGRIWALYSLFLLSMVVVVTASTAFAFLFAWELMTLLSAGLILMDGTSEERLHSLFIYLLMMHAGTAAVAASFFAFLPHSGGLDFAAMRAAGATLGEGARAVIFLVAFIGFGAKAGIIPLHVWLPKAHPIAPTPVSALMSGVMLKTAVYGFVRFGFDFLGGGPAWAGYLVLAAGAVSGVLGVLYAIGENDLKRLLAYSSVENIGIIYMGLGAALLFAAHRAPAGATLALAAALFHTLNHALFKSLLFLGAGAISDSAHTLNLEALGGLLKRMPATGAAFLIACAAISGLPLLNGFAGEWLLFQSFLAGAALEGSNARFVLPLTAGALALIGGLAAACFAKVYGVAFLGRPRSAEGASAGEAPVAMRAALVLLALACVTLGILPAVALAPLAAVAQGLVPGGVEPAEFGAMTALLPWLALGVVVAGASTLAVRRVRRITATWACGLPGLTSRMQYTATAFSKPLRWVFSAVYNPNRVLQTLPEGRPYFPASIFYRSVRTSSFERSLYRPIVNAVVAAGYGLRRLQTGNIQVYLLYVFLTLVLLLAFVGARR